MNAKLPSQYSARERKKAEYEQRVRNDAIAYASTLSIAAIANLLIEKHGWGSGANATRLPVLIADFERIIDEAGERYGDDCILTAQLSRLRGHGIELHVR